MSTCNRHTLREVICYIKPQWTVKHRLEITINNEAVVVIDFSCISRVLEWNYVTVLAKTQRQGNSAKERFSML
jgi:hypothetical protein